MAGTRDIRGLDPIERDNLDLGLIAVVSAATNGCVSCTAHHGALLRGA